MKVEGQEVKIFRRHL